MKTISNTSELVQSTLTPGLFAREASKRLRDPWVMVKHLAHIDRAITDTITGRTESILVIEAPPRHGKSELCCKYLPAWYLGTFPENRIILAMHSQSIAHDYGRKARDLMEQHGPRCFGVSVRGDSKSAENWNLEGHDGGMITAGVGTGIGGRGANLLIIDDPISGAEAAMSDRQRDKQWDWWQSEALARLEPKGVAIIIATRWHEDDLSGRLIRNAATGDGLPIRRVRLPAIAEDGDELGRQNGDPLWTTRWPLSRLELLKRDKSLTWWLSLYQQRPGRHEGAEWGDSYFDEHIWANTWPDAFEMSAIMVDPSLGKKKGDFSAITYSGYCGGLQWIDCSLERRPTEQIVSDTINLYLKYLPDVVGVETNGFQVLLAKEFDRQCIDRNIPPLPIHPIENYGNKEIRIRNIGPHLLRQKLRFRNTHGCKRLVQQLREFPLSDHDDGPDALEGAIRMLQMLAGAREQSQEGSYDHAWA